MSLPANPQTIQPTAPKVPDEFLTDLQVAARYGIGQTTVWRWRKNDPTFPSPVHLSERCVRWRMSDLLAWEAARAGSAA